MVDEWSDLHQHQCHSLKTLISKKENSLQHQHWLFGFLKINHHLKLLLLTKDSLMIIWFLYNINQHGFFLIIKKISLSAKVCSKKTFATITTIMILMMWFGKYIIIRLFLFIIKAINDLLVLILEYAGLLVQNWRNLLYSF